MEVITREHPWYTVLPLTVIVAFLVSLTGYWQLVFAAGILAGILMKRPGPSFLTGLLGGFLAWALPLGIASAYYPLAEASILLLAILGLPASMVVLPYVIAVLISSITTALGALLGAYAYALLREGRTEIDQMP
jgi:fructose-specific phosphotransferase system IIC component